ncbi:SAM complex subunit SAM50 KNAG_0H01940 [Huiozyma naganishii CBS 8797]|uniref:Bacterial surface antigen (D15) domain-containing protein n=1 Tax=Huiozyma naganishii (strain ATCC MYA-139 / BCRC 22969 / CBS 8797 / KCTC 17520 / NBRC 10181 / NCYC 3082 / Yp74L-3) TaxID=1071383 RepID=J7RPH7_HUIN7|nr:hypothetical protein KNAG_0H01940 [Kazachstania naganishii CBS 8797]CCK71608.1 hypothetical protein KNAG_0H01940 [Kazachstania naganishii CBS 8797]
MPIRPITQEDIEQLALQNRDLPIDLVKIQAVSTSSKNNSLHDTTLQTYIDATLRECKTMSELPTQMELLNRMLRQAGLINGLHPTFHTIKAEGTTDRKAALPIITTVYYQPTSKFTAKTGTNVTNSGSGDGYISFQTRLPTDEIIKLDYRHDTSMNSGARISASSAYLKQTPFWNWKFDLFDAWKCVGVRDVGASFGVRSWYNDPKKWNMSFDYELVRRKFLGTDTKETKLSEYLLIQEGSFVRSVIKNNFTKDNRDSPFNPTKGTMYKINNELGAMDNGSSFWKTVLELNHVKSWFPRDFITLSTTLRSGYIKNLNPAKSYIHFTDKFQNGGPNDVRNFQLNGIGPRHMHHSMGGDAFIAYGVSLFSKIPLKRFQDSNFRLHWYFNGGKLINHNNLPIHTLLRELTLEHSTSIGAGIVMRHPMARFELNFGVPLTSHVGDLQRKGFQFGLGFEFL